MSQTNRTLAAALLAALAGAGFLLQRRWVNHVVSSNASIAGVNGKTLPGRTFEQRDKIRPGMSEKELFSTLGEPTYRFQTDGRAAPGRLTYLYTDGKLLITLQAGYISEIETTFK